VGIKRVAAATNCSTCCLQTFFQQILSQRENGMLFLVHMRADLLQVLRKSATHSESPALRSLDAGLKVSVHVAALPRIMTTSTYGVLLLTTCSMRSIFWRHGSALAF
jgi:hypothetical protein